MSDIKTKNKRKFLKKLSELQDKYGVAICAKLISGGPHCEVTYQFRDTTKGKSFRFEEFGTGRCHSTAYETKGQSKYIYQATLRVCKT